MNETPNRTPPQGGSGTAPPRRPTLEDIDAVMAAGLPKWIAIPNGMTIIRRGPMWSVVPLPDPPWLNMWLAVASITIATLLFMAGFLVGLRVQ